MTSKNPLFHKTLAIALGLFVSALACQTIAAKNAPALLDDFSAEGTTSYGTPRFVIDDSSVGGGSHLEQRFEDGILFATGRIAPARGQPGWVSTALLVSPDGSPVDLSQYEGIRMKVRVSSGMLSVSANSAEVDNFDYHAAMVEPKAGEDFREVRIAFKDMKRAWSAQTNLDPATITGVSLVAVGIQKVSFAYAIDEIGFY